MYVRQHSIGCTAHWCLEAIPYRTGWAPPSSQRGPKMKLAMKNLLHESLALTNTSGHAKQVKTGLKHFTVKKVNLISCCFISTFSKRMSRRVWTGNLTILTFLYYWPLWTLVFYENGLWMTFRLDLTEITGSRYFVCGLCTLTTAVATLTDGKDEKCQAFSLMYYL